MGVYGIKTNVLESLCVEIISINKVLIDRAIESEDNILFLF